MQTDTTIEHILTFNRKPLQKLFHLHSSSDGAMRLPEFFRFCIAVNIAPGLVTLRELRTLLKEKGAHRPLSFSLFVYVLIQVAVHCHSVEASVGEKFKLFLLGIQSALKEEYQVQLDLDSVRKLRKHKSEVKQLIVTREHSKERPPDSARKLRKLRKHKSEVKQLAGPKEPPRTRSKQRIHHSVSLARNAEAKPSLRAPECPRPSSSRQKSASSGVDFSKVFYKSVHSRKQQVSKKPTRLKNTRGQQRAAPQAEVFTQTFLKFKENHLNLQNSGVRIRPTRAQALKQQSYIESIRSCMFHKDFVKSFVFRAWKLHTSNNKLFLQ